MRFFYVIFIAASLIILSVSQTNAFELFGSRIILIDKSFVIEIKEVDVHASPDMSSPTISKLHFGDEIKIVESKESWIRFEKDGISGWIHMSSGRTNSELKRNKSKRTVDINDRNIALATKGYGQNKDKENNVNLEFSNKELNNFKSLLQYSYSREQLIQFYKEGK